MKKLVRFILRLDDGKRRAYENYIEGLRYEASMALPYDIGKEESLKEGATKMQRQIAKSLKEAGFSLSDIVKHTGLTEKETI